MNEAPELDRGNPLELAEAYLHLFAKLPGLRVFGGCCGTDHRHIEAVSSVMDSALLPELDRTPVGAAGRP